ncbi:MAG: hypothetical protein WCK89_05870 [bacterium]
MSGYVLLNTAVKYRMADVKGAANPGGQLANILEQIEAEAKLSNTLLKYLDGKGFFALMRLGARKITYADYLPIAEQEQAARIGAAAEVERRERERVEREWRALDQQREAEQRARMIDPRYQAKIREDGLREQYGLDCFIDREDYPKIMGLVRSLDKGIRIQEEDYVWLSTHGGENYDRYLTSELESRYHAIEAEFLVSEFKRTGDPWHAVNASSLFRKCGQPGPAEKLLGGIDVSRIREAKLKSALYTTNGGVKRDLGDLAAAFELGGQAHALTPRDFRPCTLLGAVCYERGDCEQGRAWYDKAVERGFDEAAVDGELRSIFRRLDPQKRDGMREHLLGLDPIRYKWAASDVKPARQPGRGLLHQTPKSFCL